MKSIFFLLLSTVIGLGAYAQEKPRIIIDIPTENKPWNNTDWNNAPDRFQFAIVSDRTGGHRPGVFLTGIKKLNLLQPEFVMSVGDLIEGYTEDTERLDAEWREFNGFIDSLSVPFFYVPGNHDITNQVMEEKWKELFGVTYYHFVYQDVLFLCLNSEDNRRGAGRGTIDDEQYEYIKKVLEDNDEVKWTLVFLHQPLWVQEDTKRWKDVEKLLEGRSHNVFAGHYHRYWKAERNNGKYIALATTGGGSRLRGTSYGEFDHVVWVTMTDEGPLLANLLLEGIWDENVVTEDLVDLVRGRPYPVKMEPFFTEDAQVAQMESVIKLTNDTDLPMTVNLQGMVHPDLFYQLEESSLTVEPNSVESINLVVENRNQKDIREIPDLRVKSEVVYQYEGRPDVVINNLLRFKPMFRHVIGTSQVKMDGKLDEWKGAVWNKLDQMTGKPFDFDGPEDCEVKFATAYDTDNLYLAVDISDEEIYTSDKGSYWQQDAIILGIDARPTSISAENSGEGRNRNWIAYLRTFKENDPVYGEAQLPVEITSSIQTRKGGIQMELAIPISYLNEMQPNGWQSVRIGLGYYDHDSGGSERTEHYWYPAWNAEENIPGSGMMFKQ
jgi:hypothetical protein